MTGGCRHGYLFALSPERVKEIRDVGIIASWSGGTPSAFVRRNERDRMFVRKRRKEKVGPCIAVHVAADRQSQKVQDRRHDIDERGPDRNTQFRDRWAISHQETVRGGLMRSAHFRVSDQLLDHPLAETERLHS